MIICIKFKRTNGIYILVLGAQNEFEFELEKLERTSPPSPPCLERLIICHIKAAIAADLDPHQFACRANKSAEVAVVTAPTHRDAESSRVRMLLVYFSSAFSTRLSQKCLVL